MTWAYRVAIDRDDDGSFGDDISAHVLEARWQLGMDAPDQAIAAVGWARLTVWNENGAYDGAGLPMGVMLRISAHNANETLPLFTGFLVEAQPESGDWGARRAVLVAVDVLASLQAQTVRLPAQVEQTSDALVQAVLQATRLRAPALRGRWLVGRATHSALGSTTRLPNRQPQAVQAGRTRFTYAGDTWGEGVVAYDALRQIAEAERGRVFVARDGTLTFRNRHDTLARQSDDHALADDAHAVQFSHNRQRVSSVRVRYQPRSLGMPASVVWRADHAVRCPPHSTLVFSVSWRDPNTGQPIGALDVLPLEGVQFNSKADGTGRTFNEWVTASLLTADISGATLQLENRRNDTAFLLAGVCLRGTPIYIDPPASIAHRHAYSEALHGLRERVLTLPLLDAPAQADSVARFELGRWHTPRTVAHSVTVDLQARPDLCRATLFERVRLRSSTPAHDAPYWLVGEAHTLTDSGSTHHVTWTLETVSPRLHWLLGASRLTNNAYLAY